MGDKPEKNNQGADPETHMHLACRSRHAVVPFTEMGNTGGGVPVSVRKILSSVRAMHLWNI